MLENQGSQRGFLSVVLAIVFGLLFVFSTIFGVWAFSERSKYKEDTDKIVADNVAIAVQETETAKDAEFVEKEKLPGRTYKGPATYGTVTVDYPKTWSVYTVEATSGTVLDLYAFPGVVPGVTKQEVYALRIEISSNTYDKEIQSYNKAVADGDLKARAFRSAKVPDVLGVRMDGQIDTEKQGAIVILPLRDRSIKIYTESPQYVDDLTNIILPSLTFIP